MKVKPGFNRRDFLIRSAQGLGTLGMLHAGSALGDDSAEKDKSHPIIHRTFGKTGLQIPVVSMGVMNASLPEVVRRSYDLGVRHFDTAWNYQRGLNERMVGNVIKELDVRKEVIIATKTLVRELRDTQDPGKIRDIFLKRFQESLDRLQMKYVDILYMHAVQHESQLTNEGIVQAMQEIKGQGRARFIGFSSHTNMPAMIELGIEMGIWDAMLVSYNVGMADWTEMNQALDKAHKKGIGLVAMKTQAGGRWWRDSKQKDHKLNEELNHSAMLKWVLNQKWFTTAIPGYTTLEQMRENVAVASSLDYTEEEKTFLENQEIKLGLGFCRQCGECRSSCPQKVDVPELMRASMYAFQYHNSDQTDLTLKEQQQSLESCRECRTCTVQCSHGVAVQSRLAALQQLNTVYYA